MIALKTYRSGVNITKNIQNNTLNQQNNFTAETLIETATKPKKIEGKKEIKNVVKYKRKVEV